MHRSWADVEFEGARPNLEVGSLGLRSKTPGSETLYGTPDGCLRGSSPPPRVANEHVHEVAMVASDDAVAETDGDITELEMKINMKTLGQVIATAITSAFTESNIHTSDNSLIPTLFINCHTICMTARKTYCSLVSMWTSTMTPHMSQVLPSYCCG